MNYDIQRISMIKTVVCEHSPTYENIQSERNSMFDSLSLIQKHHKRWLVDGGVLDLSTPQKILDHLILFVTIHPKYKLQYDIIKRDCYHCMMCGQTNKPQEFHIDHILPKSKFPSSHPWNLQLLCKKCNLEKSDDVLDEIIPIFLDGARMRTNKYYNSDEQLIKKASAWGDTVYNTMTIKDIEKIINAIIDEKIPWRDIIK